MKKPKLLFAAAALLCGGLSANAQGWTASEPATGDFYLYNVGANAYLDAGASWGSHAALKSAGFVVTITANNGVYTIATPQYNGSNHWFNNNGYVDSGIDNWTFEPVSGLTNTYKLKNANGNYAYAAAGMYNVDMGADPGTAKGYWKLVTDANRDAASGASATNPIEWTHKINNPRFDDNSAGWQDAPARGGNTGGSNGDASSFDDRNPCAEHFNKIYDTFQELTGLPAGTYAISVQGFYREGGYTAAAEKHVDGTESLNAILYANGGGEDSSEPLMSIFEEAGKASGGTTKTANGISGAFPDNMAAASYFFSASLYWNTVFVQVTDGGTLKFGVKKSTAVDNDWTIFDNFRLQYFGNCTINEAKFGALITALNEAVTAAQGFINSHPALSTQQIAALQKIVDDNDNSDNAFTEVSQFTTAIETINNAVTTYAAMVAPYATFIALKANADAIAAVAYKETTSGSHETFADAIDAQATTAANATTAEAIVTATNTLKAAIKTYIAGAEPKNDGEFFDITCLVANPDFANNDIKGWTRTNSQGGNAQTTYNCNEFWNNTFDFYQDLTDLPNGSYQLSVQAFCRPGDNGNLTNDKKAYYDFTQGVNNVHAELYVNNDASKVGNIYAYKDATTAKYNPDDWSADYECVVEGGTNYFVPNSMAGAHQYFLDENVYKTEVAALVNSGSLRIGFRDETLTAAQWTIFTNFRLHYYGSSLLIYYKQYLPQLEAEIAENYLNNAAYAVLKDGQTERAALAQANSADANTLTTETQFEQAITAITAAREAFVLAKTAYDKLALGLASSAYNVGDGVFQMSASQDQTFATVLAAGQTMYNTGTASLAKVTAQITAISNAYVLNAPDADKRYKLTLSGKGALTFKKGGAADEGGYENPFTEANDNLAQHFTLTKVTNPLNPNVYTLSFVDLDGNTRYICVGEKAKEGLGNEKIRTTTVAADALPIIILGTTTEGVFNMVNSVTESKLGSNGGGLYTTNDATNFTIAEAAKAKVNVKIDADVKYGTRIFPFTPTLPTGVVAYTCTVEGNALNLAAVETPAADTPYVLFAESGVTGTDLEDWGLAAALTKEGGSLVGVYAAQKAPAGSYVLQNNDNKVGFYKVADGEGQQPTVGANRCYLTDPVSARPAYFFDGETTAIEALNALTSGDAEFFNAAGARIPALQKGVNIVRRADGTSYKVIVK